MAAGGRRIPSRRPGSPTRKAPRLADSEGWSRVPVPARGGGGWGGTGSQVGVGEAVVKAGEPAGRDLLGIPFGDTLVAEKGMVVPGYDEAPVAAHLAGQEVRLTVDLGLGNGRATVWTCDLTHGYISINADYRS